MKQREKGIEQYGNKKILISYAPVKINLRNI